MPLYDFVAFAVWLGLLPGIRRLARDRYDLVTGDIVFVALAVLVVLELIWLRIGYAAP